MIVLLGLAMTWCVVACALAPGVGWWLRRCGAALLIVMAVAIPAQAQAADVNNAKAVSWGASTDHAVIDGYTVELLKPDGVTVLQTLDAGKPTVSATGICVFAINVQPVAFATGYSVRVTARAGTATSDPSVSVNKFNRVPGKPGVVTIQ